MAGRVAIANTIAGRSGTRTITLTVANATDHHQFTIAPGRLLLVNNGSASPVNVTIATSKTIDGLELPDLVVAVPANSEAIIGPFPSDVYEQTGGVVHVNVSAATSVKLATITVP